ncbi:uncharacterized protein TNCV_4780181 [Trichonephila clavipes]|nr:uncharacterized protein TNCV_4780181 [Trichonephila clavipes]
MVSFNLTIGAVEPHHLSQCLDPADDLDGVFFHPELPVHVNKQAYLPAYLKQLALERIGGIPIDAVQDTDGSRDDYYRSGKRNLHQIARPYLKNPEEKSRRLLAVQACSHPRVPRAHQAGSSRRSLAGVRLSESGRCHGPEAKREELVDDALIYAKSLCEEFEISFEPRRMMRKPIFSDGSENVQLSNEEDLRRTMFSSIDKLTAEFRERFQQLQNLVQKHAFLSLEVILSMDELNLD